MSHAAFWKAICADPDDDTPRLVYADWLDEQGDDAGAARAEFIRAQVELVHLDPWTERAIDLKIRARQLLHEHRDAWLDRLPKWIGRAGVAFRRGMPGGIHCRAGEFLRNAGGVAKNTPIQELRLGQLDAEAAELIAALPHLSRIRELQLFDGSWAAWETVLASPHLTGLRELWLFDHVRGLPRGVFLDVLRLRALRPVRRLHLQLGGQTEGADDLIGPLAGVPLDDLRELDLTAEEMHPQRLAGLFKSPLGARLHTFRTGQNLDDHALGGFALAREAALKSLAFGAVYASQEELPRVFASPLLRHVEALEVSNLSEDGFDALVASPLAEQLRLLKLPNCHARAAEYRAAFASGRFRGLLELGVPMCVVHGRESAESVAVATADTPGLDGLRHLELLGHIWLNRDDAFDALLASPHLPNLRAVTLPHGFRHSEFADFAKLKAFGAKYAPRFAVLVG